MELNELNIILLLFQMRILGLGSTGNLKFTSGASVIYGIKMQIILFCFLY